MVLLHIAAVWGLGRSALGLAEDMGPILVSLFCRH